MQALLRLLHAAALLAVLAVPLPAAAQAPARRPELPAGADPNDWTAYYDHGVAIFKVRPGEAEAAFYWASRLDPERAEPLFGRWAAFWMRDYKRWEGYLRGLPRILESPEVVRNDSLLQRAMLRNPFVHRGLEVLLYDRMPGRWRDDRRTRAWLAYAQGDLARSAELFGRIIRHAPERNAEVRYERALALAAMGKFDGAAEEMTLLAAELRRRDEARVVRVYQSKEMVEYGIGLLHVARGDVPSAREAFQRAALENLGFHAAHAWLGALALEEGDVPTAVREYGEAVQIEGGDGLVRTHFATALLAGGDAAAAEVQLRAAIELEPYYAAPHALLGRALEALNRPGEALAEYERFLAMAARSDPQRDRIRQRAAALRDPSG